MGKKDDMKAALECRQPQGSVPIWELEFHLWDEVSGKHFVRGPEFEQLTTDERAKALGSNAEVILSVCEDLHFAAVTTPGTPWEQAPGVLAYYVLPEESAWAQMRVLREMAPCDLMLIGEATGVLCPPIGDEYMEFMYKLYDAPEEIDQLARQNLSSALERSKRLRDMGVEAVFCAADIADNNGPFCRPEQIERFVYPYLQKWAEKVREMGLYAILHTDGMIEPLLEKLADSGIHALQALDPVAGVDIRKVKKAIGGRVCLCGNVDCGLLESGPADKIYETTRDLLRDCKGGGGFVLGASNAVFKETPIAHYRSMLKAWEEHGAY